MTAASTHPTPFRNFLLVKTVAAIFVAAAPDMAAIYLPPAVPNKVSLYSGAWTARL